MAAAEVVFWVAVGLVAYTYFGYPVLLFGLTTLVQAWRDFRFLLRRTGRRVQEVEEGPPPNVSIVIPAHNEEAAIGEKLENCLALDYPADRLEVLVGSDGSDDRTNEIVQTFADHGVVLAAYERRRGKPSVINDTVARARGEIVVFSDATTMIERNALRKIVRHFRDARVGAVNGELRFVSPDRGYKGESLYWKYEVVLKFMENRLGVVLGSSGALCAVRKSVFRPIPANCICDDFVVTLNVMIDGWRAAYDPEAVSTEQTAASVEMESRRRERIGAGNFQALGMTLGLLNPLRGAGGWCYASHKIFKWITWLFMLVALGANMALASGRLYQGLLLGQVAFYAVALLGALRLRAPLVGKAAAVVHYFVAMHVALFRGFLRYVFGTQKVAWQREHR